MEAIDALFEHQTTTIARDLKLNLSRLLEEGALDPGEAALALLALATSVESSSLTNLARTLLVSQPYSPEQTQEAAESAAIMGMLNIYYRFRSMVKDGGANSQAEEDYKSAGLRMTSLARPNLGKVQFEMLAFAVSVLNGCQSCICSHEQVLKENGVTVEKIHDLAKLAAVVKGIKGLGV